MNLRTLLFLLSFTMLSAASASAAELFGDARDCPTWVQLSGELALALHKDMDTVTRNMNDYIDAKAKQVKANKAYQDILRKPNAELTFSLILTLALHLKAYEGDDMQDKIEALKAHINRRCLEISR